jgi:beta-galactosidase
VDAIVKSKRGAETFGAQCLTIESDFGVESVNLDQTFVELGETITGKVSLRGSPPPGSVLRIQFRDSYDRVLAQQDIELTPAKADYPIKYQPDAFATILMRVEAVLLQAGEEVDMKDASFTVPKRRHGQFNFVIWDAPSDVLGYYAWRKLQEAGISVALIGSMGGQTAQNPVLRACDASLVPYSTRILDEKDDNGFMKPVCWNDEPAVTEHVRKIVDNQKQLRQQGVFVYSLGDEGVTLGCCVHPACLAAYRRYLATQYGSIDKLNASWGTDYKSFDQVQLLDNKDIMEAAAIKTCFPRWYDRQAFARYNLMQFSARFVKAYRQLDPFALTGFEGTGGFGDDYDAILSINGFYAPYPSIGDDIIRSAAPRQLVRSNWMGYSKTADALSDAAWRMVMKGMDSIWFWMWDGIGEYRGYLSPTLDFWPATAELAEEMRPVRQGLGHLLLQSTVLHSGIAIFYSVPSALACRLENGPEFFSTESTHELWTQLTYELGLDFRYLTSAMLKSGALDPREFKVLLLPMSQAIGPEEAQAIRSFVQAGGTVIADVRPGIYDDHCKPLTPGILDDLFGIRRTGRGKPADVSLQLKATLGDIQLDVNLPKARVDTQIETASGQALSRAGEVPVLIVNNVGAGRAVLLNFQLLAFRGDSPDDPQALATRRLLRALYDAAGAKAPITVTAPDGSPLPLTETRVWQNGDALIFGLLRRMQCVWFNPKSGTIAGPPVAARITLPSPRHVYDLRAGKYLGRITTLDTRLRWGRANFFLALPYQINGLRLSLSPSAPSPGAKLTASLRLGVPRDVSEKYAVWLEITDPDGHRPLWGQKLAILSKGTGEAAFPVAYNDPPGKWRLRATELFSKASAESTWTLP